MSTINNEKIIDEKIRLKRTFWSFTGVWTVLILASLSFNLLQEKKEFQSIAIAEARANFNKDQAFRFWGASHGGVYVPAGKRTPPNPYLDHIPDRDIKKPSGELLTLMNPAYMIRQLNEDFAELYGIKGHITSLKLLRSENMPDDWERAALETFEHGNKEVLEFTEINGEPYLRLMQPMIAKKQCLKCHAYQGYKVGDIRGGVSVSLPTAPMWAIAREHIYSLMVAHASLWFFGLFALVKWSKRTLHDITERGKADAALVKEKDRLQTYLDTSAVMVVILDTDGKVAVINKKGSEILGYGKEVIIGKNWIDNFLPLRLRDEVKVVFSKLIKGEVIPVEYYENEVLTRGGEERTIAWYNAVLKDKKGNITSVLSSGTDITERQKTVEELKYVNEALAAAQSMAKVGYWSFDIKAQMPTWSEQMFDVFGVDPKKGVPTFENHKEIWHPDDWEPFVKAVSDCSTDGKSYNMVVRIIFPDKSIHFVHTQGFPRLDQEGNIVRLYGTSQDITVHKRLEEELQKMQKLESIGILAGGIAHDFNNLLAAIRNNIYLAMMHVDRENIAYENLESTENIIHRATNLTQQLLTFSKGGAPVKKTASIIELIKESAEFVLKGSNVEYEFDASDNLRPVEVDEGQINQVLHNLILNADQSMPEGGTISIFAKNINLDSGAELPLQEGKYVKLVIQDQGVGIADDNLKKIFDPYFTTKEMGRGLGLSTTYSIIKNHCGHISAESETGAGTTFTIYLPASEKQVGEKEIAENTFAAGEGRVLVMDDEEIIRESVEQLLTYNGYEIECAKDGEEAIKLYKKAMKESKPFDAVILDLTIRGGMGGKETVKKLLELDPDVKAIVASGYSNDPVLANFKKYGFCGVFAKHDKTEELGKTLHKVIKG